MKLGASRVDPDVALSTPPVDPSQPVSSPVAWLLQTPGSWRPPDKGDLSLLCLIWARPWRNTITFWLMESSRQAQYDFCLTERESEALRQTHGEVYGV